MNYYLNVITISRRNVEYGGWGGGENKQVINYKSRKLLFVPFNFISIIKYSAWCIIFIYYTLINIYHCLLNVTFWDENKHDLEMKNHNVQRRSNILA